MLFGLEFRQRRAYPSNLVLSCRKLDEFTHSLSNDLVAIATVLDPRGKMRAMKETIQSDIESSLRNALSKLESTGLDESTLSGSSSPARSTSIFDSIFVLHEAHELEHYLASPCEVRSTDVMQFWRSRTQQYPQFQKLDRKILCIQTTSVPSERAFSLAGLIDIPLRNRISPDSFRSNMLLSSWLKLLR